MIISVLGKQINFQKSKIFFSKNVKKVSQNTLAAHLRVVASLGSDKYLGVSSMIGKSKKSLFKFIKDRVWKKTNS